MPESSTRERTPRPPRSGSDHVRVLAVIEGVDPAAVHRVVLSECTIGRDTSADLTIEGSEISARHCLVRASGSVCTLQDLESLNGTTLNGRKLTPGVAGRLRHLDEILIGSTRLLFLSGRCQNRPRSD